MKFIFKLFVFMSRTKKKDKMQKFKLSTSTVLKIHIEKQRKKEEILKKAQDHHSSYKKNVYFIIISKTTIAAAMLDKLKSKRKFCDEKQKRVEQK